MGGINPQKWVVYYCYTHMISDIPLVSRVFSSSDVGIPLQLRMSQAPHEIWLFNAWLQRWGSDPTLSTPNWVQEMLFCLGFYDYYYELLWLLWILWIILIMNYYDYYELLQSRVLNTAHVCYGDVWQEHVVLHHSHPTSILPCQCEDLEQHSSNYSKSFIILIQLSHFDLILLILPRKLKKDPPARLHHASPSTATRKAICKTLTAHHQRFGPLGANLPKVISARALLTLARDYFWGPGTPQLQNWSISSKKYELTTT